MIVFSDILTGDEMVTDSFDMKEVGDGIAYEVDGALITVKQDDVDTGANASAEETAEALEDGATQIINIVHTSRLQTTQFDKKTYLTYLKGYMKAVKAKMVEQGKSAEEVKEFETKASTFVKEKILAGFKDWEFYTGESMNPDGMVALLNYREDGVTPYFIFWKHGLKGEKY